MNYMESMNSIESCYKQKQEQTPSHNFVYVVPMFPYPSGNIHMGHVRNYTITNAIAQYHRVKGKDVIHPIGFDAFGLPAENAAIKHKMSPNEWTESNIKKMTTDFQNIGFDFNWNASIQTNKPDYYKFEQDIFKMAWTKGVIYKKDQYVNYDPVDNTVLSNEQVKDGKGWRTGATVIRKKVPMYFFDMKRYAKELNDDLDVIKGSWPSQVIEMQKNWIGFEKGHYQSYNINGMTVNVFDNSKPANAVVIGINHSFAQYFSNDDFISWIKENEVGSISNKDTYQQEKFFDTGFYVVKDTIKYPVFIDMNRDDEAVFFKTKKEGIMIQECSHIETYEGEFIKLKDWCISRQRYWGNPIPMIHCHQCGDNVADGFVELPTHLIPDVGNALKHDKEFMTCVCPNCNMPAERCTDTMDTFVQSSWYFHAYITKMFGGDKGITNPDTQIDYYVGGVEHATMHLIYTRFFHKMLRDFGFVNTDEPIKRLITQGMVCKKYINEEGKSVSAKMSKSIGNIVEPQMYIDQYGSDALQMFMIFAAPPSQNFDFEDDGIVGSYRFLDSVYRYFTGDDTTPKTETPENAKQAVDKMIQQFDKEFSGRMGLNTLVPQLMTAFKVIKKTQFEDEAAKKEIESDFVKYLSVFAPKIAYYIQNRK